MFFEDKNYSHTLKAFCKRYRNYKPYDVSWGIVKKVWNHGMGAISFIRVYSDKRILAVNKLFWNRTDEKKLECLKGMLGGEWRVVWCEYGYPAYYNHSFSLNFAIDENERN